MHEIINQIKAYFDPYIETTFGDWLPLKKHLKIENYRNRQIIKNEGTVEYQLRFILKGGGVHLYNLDEKKICLDICLENEFFNDLNSLSSGNPSEIYLKTFEDMKVVSIERDILLELYEQSPIFSKIGRVLADQHSTKAYKVHLAHQGNIKERVRRLHEERPNVLLRTPQIYVASFLGISPESLSRIRGKREDFDNQ